MSETDYLLGVHDEEIARLGLQHRVWRPKVLDAWRRAGVSAGSRVIDVGAGPGWATLDLAEIVGRDGRVVALERSERYLAHLRASVAARGLVNVEAHQVDLALEPLPAEGADAAWIRWVLAFMSRPADVLEKLSRAVRPGGVLVIHEYFDYRTWKLSPARPEQDAFAEFMVQDWKASGGDPDVGRDLPALLPEAGFRIREARPLIEVTRPGDDVWRWPSSFVRTYLDFIVGAGKVEKSWADGVLRAFAEAEADPRSLMVTPLVIEIIAERE